MAGNEIEIVVSSRNNANLNKLGDDAKKAGKEVETGLKKGFEGGEDAAKKTTKKIESELDKTGDSAKAAGKKIEKGIGDGADKAAEGIKGKLSSGLESGVSSGIEAGKAGIAGAGIAIGTALLGGLAQSFEQEKLGGLIAAQVGAGSAEVGKLGHTAGAIYADNFGDSMEEVGDAIRDVIRNKLVDASSSEEAIKQVVEQVMTVSKVVGEETGRVARAVRQLLVNGLADSTTEAMDIIVQANKQGLNSEEDLIDTIVEYSTKFRDLGITGPEAMGLISQAMDAGARDTDTAADALKEFAIRAIDGSESTARGFKTLGLDAGQMGEMIAAGGNRAHEGLKITLNAMRNIHDPIVANQVAVDLFGTKAEDLGNALAGMDLDTAAAKFGEFAGQTQKAADTITDSTPAWENFKRGLSDLPVKFVEWGTADDDLDNAVAKLKERNEALKEGGSAERDHADNVEAARRAVQESTEAIAGNTMALDENISMHEKAAGGVLNLWDAENQHAEALEKANESLKKNKKNMDYHTEGGRANREALADLAKTTYDQIAAMERQGATAGEIQGVIAAQREEFVALATRMLGSAAAANALADQLGLIPGDYKANVYVNNAQANAAIQNTQGLLAMLRDKTIHLSVQETRFISKEAQFGAFKAAGGPTGAGMQHRAEGGPGNSVFIGNEQGGEIISQPNGSTVIPAGMSAALFAGALGRGPGGGGSAGIDVHFSGNLDSAFASAWMKLYDDGLIRIRAR